MTIDDAERKFGKRWNAWTEAEWDEFMAELTPDFFRKPLFVLKACEYNDKGKLNILPIETRLEAEEFLKQGGAILSCLQCNKIPTYKLVENKHIIKCQECGVGSVHIESKALVIKQWNNYRGKSLTE